MEESILVFASAETAVLSIHDSKPVRKAEPLALGISGLVSAVTKIFASTSGSPLSRDHQVESALVCPENPPVGQDAVSQEEA